jgi:hypothetical protein
MGPSSSTLAQETRPGIRIAVRSSSWFSANCKGKVVMVNVSAQCLLMHEAAGGYLAPTVPQLYWHLACLLVHCCAHERCRSRSVLTIAMSRMDARAAANWDDEQVINFIFDTWLLPC